MPRYQGPELPPYWDLEHKLYMDKCAEADRHRRVKAVVETVVDTQDRWFPCLVTVRITDAGMYQGQLLQAGQLYIIRCDNHHFPPIDPQLANGPDRNLASGTSVVLDISSTQSPAVLARIGVEERRLGRHELRFDDYGFPCLYLSPEKNYLHPQNRETIVDVQIFR